MSNRRERRNADPEVRIKREQFLKSNPGGGYGIGASNAVSAGGQSPAVNPFYQPKNVGVDIFSQFFPPSYFVEWDISLHRKACDQAMLMGYMSLYATLTTWTFQSSPFVRSLFRKYETVITKNPIYLVDKKKNKIEDWSEEITNKPWFTSLCKEILLSKFWGCTGLNFNPITETCYKYPMQQLDPINRDLRSSTYNFTNVSHFADNNNLLFIQPSTTQEEFLGYMQTITRDYIAINVNYQNWLQGGTRLAFPILTVGYPHNDGAIATDEAGNILYDTNGNALKLNPFKREAEDIAANIDPSRGVTYPYTLAEDGKTMIKSIDIDFKTPSSGRAYTVFPDFNNQKKNELREWLLGSDIMGHNPDKGGTRSLGEVHLLSWEDIQSECIEFVLHVLNDDNDFLKKIKSFYKNFPDNATFEINRVREMEIKDVEAYSNILTQNGKQFTDEFFIAQGIAKEFFDDVPAPVMKAPMIPEKGDKFAANPKLLEAIKKKEHF